VEDAAAAELLRVDGGDDVGAREPAVDDDGQAGPGGERELGPQGFALDVRRREVVVIIEADLPDGPDDAARGQGLEPFEMARGEVLGLVGVDAGRGQDGREFGGQPGDRREALRTGQVGRAEDGDDPGGESPPDDVAPVGVELGHVQVGVGVDEAHSLIGPS
jgi:hypothetical protein